MNKATISIAIFIIVVVLGLIVFRAQNIAAPEASEEPQVSEEEVVNEEEETTSEGETGGFAPMISQEELATHNSADDCWIAYQGSVFDVTDWLTKHPGGSAAIAQYCGTSEEFEQALNRQHGEKQQNMLPEVGQFMGTLGVIGGVQS